MEKNAMVSFIIKKRISATLQAILFRNTLMLRLGRYHVILILSSFLMTHILSLQLQRKETTTTESRIRFYNERTLQISHSSPTASSVATFLCPPHNN